MRQILIAAVSMIAVSACNASARSETREAGAETSRDYAVGAFTRIEVSGPYKVEVTTGGSGAVRASGGGNLLDQTEVYVKDGALVIRPKKQNGLRLNWGRSSARFAVSTAALEAAAIAGSGEVDVDKATGDFRGEVAGSGKLNVASLSGGDAKFEVAGSGEVFAAGTADSVGIDIAGSGTVDTAALKSRNAEISIAGSGDVRADASETADISIAGSGNVNVTGGAKCTQSKMGSGNIRCS